LLTPTKRQTAKAHLIAKKHIKRRKKLRNR
jgi:hypothetical protein